MHLRVFVGSKDPLHVHITGVRDTLNLKVYWPWKRLPLVSNLSYVRVCTCIICGHLMDAGDS